MTGERDLLQAQQALASRANDTIERKCQEERQIAEIGESIDSTLAAAEKLLKESGWWNSCSGTAPTTYKPRGEHPNAALADCQQAALTFYNEMHNRLVKPLPGGSIQYRRPSSPFGWALIVGFGIFLTISLLGRSSGTNAAGLFVGGGAAVLIMIASKAPAPPAKGPYASLLGVAASASVLREQCEAQLATEYERYLREEFHPVLARFDQAVCQVSPNWDDPIWQHAPVAQSLPEVLRIGALSEPTTGSRMPALLPALSGRSLLVKAEPETNVSAIAGIQSIALRLLSSIPPGKLRLTIIDPLALGQSVAPFMALADHDESLVTGKAWTEPNHIEQRLADLTEHMENVIQKYLRNDFATIADYNRDAGRMAEPYRLLLVFDFPTNMSETAVRRLVSIVKNGSRCGVLAVVLAGIELKLPHGLSPAELEQNCNIIQWNEQHRNFELADDLYRHWTFEWDVPPAQEALASIIASVGTQALEGRRVEVPFSEICTPPAEGWTATSKDGISIALGPSGARKVQVLKLGDGTAQHVLVAGKTGSGKSTLLHIILTGLALTYSPEELQVYLVDFKKGVEFKCYAAEQLPHARVIAIESEREFGLSVLQGLDAELKNRGELFREASVDHIASYRERTGNTMPRILLVVDEFHEFFTEDDQIASLASQILDRLVRQGRAFGMHVLLGSQTLSGAYNLTRSTVDQMAVRIALQCSEADSRLILADDNPAARLLSRPGEAVYNASNGLVEGNSIFQVAWLEDDERNALLGQVRELARAHGGARSAPIVFEGNAPARVEGNDELIDLLALQQWAGDLRSLRSWVGEPVTIASHVAAQFRNQSGGNLLVVGQREESAVAILSHVLVALGAQLPPIRGEVPFHVFDFSLVDAEHAGVLQRVASALPHGNILRPRRDLLDSVQALSAEVDRRLSDPERSYPPIFLVIHGLQRARDLRPDDDGGLGFLRASGGQDEAASQQFAKIVREGPELAIHTMVWCDTLGNLNRSTGRRALREFAMRIAFQMSAEDSSSLIDTPLASRLGPFRALFLDENEGRLEKFRPYGVPSDAWLAQVAVLFARKVDANAGATSRWGEAEAVDGRRSSDGAPSSVV